MGRIVARMRQAAVRMRPGFKNRQGSAPSGVGQSRAMSKPRPNANISGAMLRAMLAAVLVMLPALLVPQTATESAQLMVLLALFAAGIVFSEYSSEYPGIIEFRFAAPFNRSRFMLAGLMVVSLSLLMRAETVPGWPGARVEALAASCGQFLDFAFSPVRLLVAALPGDLPQMHLQLVHDGAALALSLGIATVLGFALAIRLKLWPLGSGPFNVWINLPTFDPTAGNDVVSRLIRTARINIALGLALPFLLPGVFMASSLLVQPLTLESPLGFVWGIVLWAIIPVSLLMRGIAMLRVARMIRANRRQFADSEGNALATA